MAILDLLWFFNIESKEVLISKSDKLIDSIMVEVNNIGFEISNECDSLISL